MQLLLVPILRSHTLFSPPPKALEELRQVSSKKAGAALLALGLFAYSRQLLQEYLQLLRRWHPDKTADKVGGLNCELQIFRRRRSSSSRSSSRRSPQGL